MKGLLRLYHRWRAREAKAELEVLMPECKVLNQIADAESNYPRIEEPGGRFWAIRAHECNLRRMQLEGQIRYHEAKMASR